MEPRIQYAQTKDGVSIAYWTMGRANRSTQRSTAGASSSPSRPPAVGCHAAR